MQSLLCDVFLLLLVCGAPSAAAAASSAAAVPSKFERRVELDGQAGCTDVQWTADLENRKLMLSWKSAMGAEWTAFGVTDYGTMKGADIAVVKMKGGTSSPETNNREYSRTSDFVVEDRYSKSISKPKLDVLQNVELLSAKYLPDEDRMEVVIERDLDSCDFHDIKIEAHEQYIICASGSLDEDGDISYHGRARSSGVVNFLVDENLLFDQVYDDELLLSTMETNGTVLSDGVLARGNLEEATSPIPIDMQMRGITLEQNVVTHYMCSSFSIPTDLRFTSVEDVWGDGQTASSSGGVLTNEVFHHMHLHYCEDPEIDPEYRDGAVGEWDCFDRMPRCVIKASFAKGTGRNSLPSGLHFELPAGTYILQVHYENPFFQPIVNDRTGMRLWVQPPALTSRTRPAGLLQLDALHDSIQIPADPHQKELAFQFQISADATKDYIPEDGVLVFGALFHMHNLGAWGKVELIRDGKRVQTVFQSMSFDFDRQVPKWDRWRLMPGDAVVVTCSYTPLVDRDVHGGFGTKDEMCGVHMATAPEIPNLGRFMGAFVRPDEPFLNSYMGPASINARTLNYSSYQYLPNPMDRSTYDTMSDFGENLCHTMVRANMHPSWFRFSDAALCAQIIMIGVFLFTRLLSWKPVAQLLGIDHDDPRDKKNSIVYIGEMLFSCVALPLALITLVDIFPDNGYYDAVDLERYTLMRGLVTMQVLLYLLELFYRIEARFSLTMHHILTSVAVISLYAFETQTYSALAYKYGLVLMLLAFTEQPLYTVLLLRNLGYRERRPKMFRRVCVGSIAIFVATRIVVVGLLVALVLQNWDESATAWRLRKESYADWWRYNEGSVNPVVVNVVMCLLSVGLLCANAAAVKALVHMMMGSSSSSSTTTKKKKDENDVASEDDSDRAGTFSVGEDVSSSFHSVKKAGSEHV